MKAAALQSPQAAQSRAQVPQQQSPASWGAAASDGMGRAGTKKDPRAGDVSELAVGGGQLSCSNGPSHSLKWLKLCCMLPALCLRGLRHHPSTVSVLQGSSSLKSKGQKYGPTRMWSCPPPYSTALRLGRQQHCDSSGGGNKGTGATPHLAQPQLQGISPAQPQHTEWLLSGAGNTSELLIVLPASLLN